MSDTAQPTPAAETVDAQIDNASDAFKSFLNPETPRVRDEKGRFAREDEQEEQEIEAEAEEPAEALDDDEQAEDVEAAEEAQPEAVPMPSSWSADQAEQWDALPPETQAYLAEREGQRDAAVNAKFQEAANIRKANEALVQEAATNRDRYANELKAVIGLYEFPEPDPDAFVDQEGNFHQYEYQVSVKNWRESQKAVSEYRTQLQEIEAQRDREAEQAMMERYNAIEATARPALLAAVPDIADPQKSNAVLHDILSYAISVGIPEDVITSSPTNSAELLLAWKAMQYDRQQEAAKRVQAKKPAPKPAAPPVKPGGIASRQSVERSRFVKATERLAREGSVEAGAAVFKHLFR